MRAPAEAGFSLIEALVALAVLAVAATGLIRAAEAHVDAVRALEGRAAAQWVAENRLAALSVSALRAPDAPVEMLGHAWRTTTRLRPTDDPDLRAVTVEVRPDGATSPTLVLDGFLDVGNAA